MKPLSRGLPASPCLLRSFTVPTVSRVSNQRTSTTEDGYETRACEVYLRYVNRAFRVWGGLRYDRRTLGGALAAPGSHDAE